MSPPVPALESFFFSHADSGTDAQPEALDGTTLELAGVRA